MSTKSFAVLLVDDDKDDREVFGEALHAVDETISLSEAYDGIDALEKMYQSDFPVPDLIFLDLNMPRMNGLQVLQEMRQMESYRKVPVIVYSTSSRTEDVKYLAELGASEYMIKHNSFQELRSELQQAVNLYLNKTA